VTWDRGQREDRRSDEVTVSRVRDAEVLAELRRCRRGRWRRDYAIGAALFVLFIGATLRQLGVPLALGALAAALFVAVVWATERMVR
jgi:hypothetical protein